MTKRINDTLGHEYVTAIGISPVVMIGEGRAKVSRMEVMDRSPTSQWLPVGVIGGGFWYATANASAEVFQENGMLPEVVEYW